MKQTNAELVKLLRRIPDAMEALAQMTPGSEASRELWASWTVKFGATADALEAAPKGYEEFALATLEKLADFAHAEAITDEDAATLETRVKIIRAAIEG